MRSVELFTGAGGLAMGTAMAGFNHLALVEFDKRSYQTICENQSRKLALISNWSIHQMNVVNFDYSTITAEIELLAGGPPCQPFSIGGKHAAYLDKRDMFPQFLRAVRELRPKAFLIENVRGLLRQTFASYFEYIILQLSYPELLHRSNESWLEHLARLKCYEEMDSGNELSYKVTYKLINTADYGIPQKRERVFIVGFRSDLAAQWFFPEPSHSEEALIWHKWITGEYWERHNITSIQRPNIPAKLRTRLEREGANLYGKITAPWHTVRDAIADLPPPGNKDMNNIFNHIYIPGAKTYPGHTGSPIDEPAKTLKAGVHGVPGGENMLALPDGQVRYFTVREAARLQTFPDNYYFPHAWGECMRQIGNAVPVTFAYFIARSIYSHLQEIDSRHKMVGASEKN